MRVAGSNRISIGGSFFPYSLRVAPVSRTPSFFDTAFFFFLPSFPTAARIQSGPNNKKLKNHGPQQEPALKQGTFEGPANEF